MITKDTPPEEVAKHAEGTCKACGHCCGYGGCFVLSHEVTPIAKHLGITEMAFIEEYTDTFEKFHTKQLRTKIIPGKNGTGPCIFLKEKKCQIHEVKPLHCRVSTCDPAVGKAIQQWYSLTFFVNTSDAESVRQWNTFLKSEDEVIQGGMIEELVLDKERRKQILTYEVLE